MPNNLLRRAEELVDLRERTRSYAEGTMRKWSLKEILADKAALGGLVGELLEGANSLLEGATRQGRDMTTRMMKTVRARAIKKGGADFQAQTNNALSDAADKAMKITERFLEDLDAEATRLAGRGVDAKNILRLVSEDWEKENRGPISGQLWAGLARLLSDLCIRVYAIAEQAAWFGQEIIVGG